MRFIGEYLAKTDAKGRVFFPAAFRKVVDTKGAPQSFVLRSDLFQKCLVLYPESVWNSRLDEMQARMNHWNGEHQDMLRRFVAGVEMQELDKSGRLLLTKRKLQAAGITDEVRFVGMDDRIETMETATLISPSTSINRRIQNIATSSACLVDRPITHISRRR